jgi:uncharacterized membrane protein YkvA (DUF1232 family)
MTGEPGFGHRRGTTTDVDECRDGAMDYRGALVDLLPALLIGILVLLGMWALLVLVVWRSAPSRATASDVVRLLPDLLRMTAGLARDPATPRSCKVALGGLAVWLASPIDLIPEFVPVIGPLDDIVVSAIVLRWVGRRVGEDALRGHWPGSDEGFGLVLRLLGRPVA